MVRSKQNTRNDNDNNGDGGGAVAVLRTKGGRFSVHAYVHEENVASEIRSICDKLFWGADYVPKILGEYVLNDLTRPYIIQQNDENDKCSDGDSSKTRKIATFFVLRSIVDGAGTLRSVWLEAVRVDERLRGLGITTALMETSVHIVAQSAYGIPVRAAITCGDRAMETVMKRVAWDKVCTVGLWPHSDIFYEQKSACEALAADAFNEGTMLSRMNLMDSQQDYRDHASPFAWSRVKDSNQVRSAIRALHAGGEASAWRASYFVVGDVEEAGRFLETPLAAAEGRSVWKYEGRLADDKNTIKALLFARPFIKEMASVEDDGTISAMVTHLKYLEPCVRFANGLKGFPVFRIAFEVTPDAEAFVQSSPLLAPGGLTLFSVYQKMVGSKYRRAGPHSRL